MGDMQSISFDLNFLYGEVPATTLDFAFDEVLHGSVNFLDTRSIGVDQWGVRRWTVSGA
ncbi:hypothetical protein ACWKWC_03310 [Geodermatophilus nigrescens]